MSNHVWQADLYDEKLNYVSEFGKRVVELLSPKSGEKVLDLACGTGNLVPEITQHGATVIGMDLSVEMIDTAKKKYPDIEFIVGNAEDFVLDQQVDAVFSNSALHWMTKPERVIDCVWRALKPGGRFVAEFGGRGNIATIIDGIYRVFARDYGIDASTRNPWYFPSIAAYSTLLEQQGFRVLFAAHFDRPTKMEDGEDGLNLWLTGFADHFFAGFSADADPEAAEIAGWLHDISAVFPNQERIAVARELGVEVLPEEEMFPMIIHQKISKVMARDIFMVTDQEILDAIGCHTTLRARSTLLDKILFVADKIAWDQAGTPPYIEDLMFNLEKSLTQGAFSYISYLWERKDALKVIHPWLKEAYEDLANNDTTKLVQIMTMSPRTVQDLRLVQSLGLNNWYIAAGYVRNQVWDYLHSHKKPTNLDDVDVIYFDKTNTSEASDQIYAARLSAMEPSLNWSVKNQARMHIRNGHEPYADVADAMKRWPETATAVGITLTDKGEIEVLAPHGLTDLFELVVRQSPCCADRDIFMQRVYGKKWLEKWSKLKVVAYK